MYGGIQKQLKGLQNIMNKKLQKRFEEQSNSFLEYLGIELPYEAPLPKWEKKTDQNKILVFSDPHEPYAIDELFDEAYKEHKDAETVIIAGDLGDYYSKSRFRKKYSVNLKDEMRAIFHRMQWLSMRFKYVKIMKGNHDDRPEKKIADLFCDGDIDLRILTESDVLTRLASYFDNIEMVGTRIHNHVHEIMLSHIYQHGDAIFTHGELSRKQDSAVMEYISNYLHRWSKKLRLKPYNVIIQAHNHRASKTVKGEELWFLNPCAMEDISIGGEYIYQPRMIGDPPVRGYTVLYQEDGVTDWNKSNIYIYQGTK